MSFELKFTDEARRQFEELSQSKNLQKRFKAVRKALKLLANDPSYPGLRTHKYSSFHGPEGTDVFEAYAENNTPAAYRIFWCYYPPKSSKDTPNTITVLAIIPHP